MVETILGITIALIPFVLVFVCADRLRGFLYVVISVVIFHMGVGLVTQAMHLFLYGWVLGINAVAGAVCLFIYFKKSRGRGVAVDGKPLFSFFRRFWINWAVFAAFGIVFFELFSVHYFYSGTVSTVYGFDVVPKSAYVYPYYSDEWVGASFADYSIKNDALPLVNPLDTDRKFSSPLFLFYSLMAEIFLLIHLSPIVGWALAALCNGLFVCVLAFILLRVNKAGIAGSLVAMLSIPFVTNATNLPGIWYLIPFTATIGIFLAVLIALSRQDFRLGMFATVPLLLLYPPMIVFLAPLLFVYLFMQRTSVRSEWRRFFEMCTVLFCIIAIIFLLVFLLLKGNFAQTVHLVESWIARKNLDAGVVYYDPWHVIPWPILIVSIVGCAVAVQKKMYLLLTPIAGGLIFWIGSFVVQYTFVIDESRSVSMAALLFVFTASLGFEKIIAVLRRYPFFNNGGYFLVPYILGVVFVSVALFYPVGQLWATLTLHFNTLNGPQVALPTAPVNRYLEQDDIRLFQRLSGAHFIAPPWKGLAIGVTTGNYPLESKTSTVSVSILRYSDFTAASCDGKNKLALDSRLDFAYAPAFDCPQFREIGSSTEGFYLYRFIK